MCSQPPKDVDDGHIVAEHLRLIDLFESPPQRLCITGGEPTLLKEGLVQIITRLKERFPETFLLMLSNGRMYAYEDFIQKLAAVEHPNFLTSIPLYAGNATDHDYVVQAKGAFDQTIQGFYNAAKHDLAVEVRVVLHKQTIPGLLPLVEFIYRNLPFVRHVALMGLENMGYVKKNWDLLWIDPVDYGGELEAAVRHLYQRRVQVSVYNLPLCVLPRSLWSFARQSISDFKNIYLDECDKCRLKEHCSGLFQSSEVRHSRAIQAVV
jgi:His-Xaa-Ser system radical SAM maturase HxsC